jgi:hypothetical protein
MKNNNRIVVLFIFHFLFSHYISFSQNNKDAAPLFVLQGTVKLKGKPVGDVVLTLIKDGKQVAKNVTPKNGLYYFQMNKSNTDVNSEYQLNISKAGVAEGILHVNTYIPKEEFSPLPYMFNLEISLISPDTGSTKIEKHNFGKITWFSEKKAFDFDKEYAVMIEKEQEKQKQLEKEKIIADSIKLVQEQMELAKKNEKEKEDSILNANKINTQELANAKNKTNTNNKNSESNAATGNSKDVVKKNKTKKDKDNEKQTTNELTDSKNTEESTNTKKNQQQNLSNANSEKNSSLTKTDTKNNNTKKSTSETSNKTSTSQTNTTYNNKKTNEVAATSSQSNEHTDNIKKTTDSKDKTETTTNSNTNESTSSSSSNNKEESSNTDKQKDLFFLTGVPMGQFKKILSDASNNSKNSFDAEAIYSLSNERNRIENAKTKMAKKKAENFAKKHETNNTLTSLLNVVDENDKK